MIGAFIPMPQPAPDTTRPARIRDMDQAGWNQGYAEGSQERADLAADLAIARRELDRLRAVVAKHCPGEL